MNAHLLDAVKREVERLRGELCTEYRDARTNARLDQMMERLELLFTRYELGPARHAVWMRRCALNGGKGCATCRQHPEFEPS